jgi:hypothetical protein
VRGAGSGDRIKLSLFFLHPDGSQKPGGGGDELRNRSLRWDWFRRKPEIRRYGSAPRVISRIHRGGPGFFVDRGTWLFPHPSAPSPLLNIVLIIAAIGMLAGGGFIARRRWIRRQNPALFREYD